MRLFLNLARHCEGIEGGYSICFTFVVVLCRIAEKSLSGITIIYYFVQIMYIYLYHSTTTHMHQIIVTVFCVLYSITLGNDTR